MNTKRRFTRNRQDIGLLASISRRVFFLIEQKTALAQFKYHDRTVREYHQLMICWCLPLIMGGIGLLGALIVPGKFFGLMAFLLFSCGCYIPWKIQGRLVQDFEKKRDRELGEFFETMSLFINSGHTIDYSLTLAVQAVGDVIKNPLRQLVLELGALSKGEAVDNFVQQVGGVQVKLFGDALKQGYSFSSEFLVAFFDNQAQIMANLRAQRVSEAIQKAPNQATMANLMIAFATLLILVGPYAINLFEGLTK